MGRCGVARRSLISSTTVVGGYSKEAYEHVSYFHIEKNAARAGVDSLGEDAFYVNSTVDRFDSYGVADGVGGWRNQGVDRWVLQWVLRWAIRSVLRMLQSVNRS